MEQPVFTTAGTKTAFVRQFMRPQYWVVMALLATLAGPFLLQPKASVSATDHDRRLVILSPHNERVRHEIGQAFADDWKTRTGETVYLDWRIPGGSSEISLFMKSEFAGAFQYEWQGRQHQSWRHDIGTDFADPRTLLTATGPAADARRAFLASNTGIGVDLLFGGGSYDFQQLADAGYLVAGDPAAGIGISALMAEHPEWFSANAIPEVVSGEPFRDRQQRWVGVVLATFGIVFNRDVLDRLNFDQAPTQWSDLADPRLVGQVAMADPTKSGSVAKAFELIIQQQMAQSMAQHSALPNDQTEETGVREGWLKGLRLIQRMSANARYFTDSATKISLEVSRGDAAAGMAIDAYGRAAQEFVRMPSGESRVGFVSPTGGTSVSVDPIALLRGAPEPQLATAFMRFVLSERGQKLWGFRPGTPDGPVSHALRRLPVRRNFYTETHRQYMTDAGEHPYVQAEDFVYHPQWTGPMLGAIRFLIRVMCVDTHREQRGAWQAIIAHGMPADALAAFHDLPGISYQDVKDRIMPILRAKDKVAEVRLARELGAVFRRNYQMASRLAEAHGAES
jgi:ABC-type Fe3+ transport system substrate-binding protein